MEILVIIVPAAAILLLVYYLRQRGGQGTGRVKTLRQECRRLLKQSPISADETIDRYMANLKDRYPGHTEEWYLEKIIYDLERDR